MATAFGQRRFHPDAKRSVQAFVRVRAGQRHH